MKRILFFALVVLGTTFVAADDGVRRVVRMDDLGTQLLDVAKFRPYEKGYEKTPEGFLCDNAEATKQQRGVAQSIGLNQKVAAPIIASAWSRAENVGGSADFDYSLYLDLVFIDGSSLWGQAASFPVGTRDWNRREVIVFPEKPIKSLTVYTLFRNHSGKAWFRDVELRTLDVPEGGCRFDGVPVAIERQQDTAPKLLIRDVATNGDFFDTEKNKLGVDIKRSAVSPSIVEYALASRDGADHLLTLVYTVPVARNGLVWCDDPRRTVDVVAPTEYSKTTSIVAGANGRLSRFPFTAVAGPQGGKAVGIDMLYPAVFRTGYNAATEELFVAADIALTKEKRTATLRFCNFSFEPKLGFRGALAEFYRLFPEQFRCRTPKQGVWMPFAKISKVEGWEDFGFMFKEGNDETAWDDEHGILTFRYTEPTTWWMSMSKELPRTMDVALAEVDKLIAKGDARAKTLLSCGMRDVDGNLVGKFLDTPWSNGIVWSINELPGLPEPNAFSIKWGEAIIERLYGPNKKADLDGEYVDSAEGYVTAQLDFCREHFSAAKRPLAFDKETLRPGIYRGLVLQEYCEKIAADVHAIGKLSFANSTPSSLCWLAPHFDVLGTETNWNRGKKWSPMSDADLLYRRALCGPKPYCFLMNTVFDDFSYELTELFMKRSLAYGMFPGFFSADASTGHYFSRPELYNRDRALFKKYVPLCKMVAEAGWNPITEATSSDPSVYVERFGNYLTIFNDSKETKTVTITISKRPATLKEHVRGLPISVKNGTFDVVIDPEDVLVVEEP